MRGKSLACAVIVGLSVSAFAETGIDRQMLVDLIAIPSENRNLTGLRCGIGFLKEWLERRGVFCAVEENECGYQGLYAATSPGKVHDYLFVSHVDVVKAPAEMFKPRVEGDRIYGRGACDTKGNVVVMCQVLANLVGKASVGLFVTTDEEGGGEGTRIPQLMIARGYVPRKAILVGDTTGDSPRTLFTAEKGHAVFTLYNDDRFVPQFLADGLSPEDARAYIGSGCWDGVVESVQEADTCNYVSLVKLLELMIYRNAETERRLRLRLRPIENAATFEEYRTAKDDYPGALTFGLMNSGGWSWVMDDAPGLMIFVK